MATANLFVEGAFYPNSREGKGGDNWMMNGLPNMEPIPKLVEEPSSVCDHAILQSYKQPNGAYLHGERGRLVAEHRKRGESLY